MGVGVNRATQIGKTKTSLCLVAPINLMIFFFLEMNGSYFLNAGIVRHPVSYTSITIFLNLIA